MKEQFKNIKPILQTKKEPLVKDPVRFPRVINAFENQSKRDFAENLKILGEHLTSEINKH